MFYNTPHPHPPPQDPGHRVLPGPAMRKQFCCRYWPSRPLQDTMPRIPLLLPERACFVLARKSVDGGDSTQQAGFVLNRERERGEAGRTDGWSSCPKGFPSAKPHPGARSVRSLAPGQQTAFLRTRAGWGGDAEEVAEQEMTTVHLGARELGDLAPTSIRPFWRRRLRLACDKPAKGLKLHSRVIPGSPLCAGSPRCP